MKKKGSIATLVLLICLACTTALIFGTSESFAQDGNTEAIEDSIVALQNAYRAQAGLAPLTEIDALAQAADIRAGECGISFSHTRPDGSIWWTVEPDLAYGENLAYGYRSAEEAVNAWMCSAAHMYNILSPDYRTCGVGVVMSGGTWYYVVEFGY
ncbi:MAG: CAP domain-containing protein [Lachnospiraceae bacterium]|nr:CAP domain-containing protein [Lachnospiraceae bacterium]